MNPRTVRSFSICFFLLTALSLVPAQQLERAPALRLGMSEERLERLTDVFQAYVDEGKLPGAVILVTRFEKIAYLKSFGYRDVESKDPMKDDAIFRIASQTKALVSAGIMMLQEDGKLLITDPVGKYIPSFAATTVAVQKDDGAYGVVPAARQITIKDLLTHTAGIGYGWGAAADEWKAAGIQGWYFADRDEPIAKTVERMASIPMDAQPGTKFVYGYNTDILGVVIERVSGMPLDEFLRERIFEPLGMNDTYFYLPDEKAGRLATVYSAMADGSIVRAPDPGDGIGQGMYVSGPRKSFSGGAGVLSTAHDYAAFLRMLVGSSEYQGARVVSRKSIELMTVDHLGDVPYRAGLGFGLGFEIIEDLGDFGRMGSEGAFGWGGAYHSTYWVDPKEQLVVVYFTQLIPARGLDDHLKLRSLIYQSLID